MSQSIYLSIYLYIYLSSYIYLSVRLSVSLSLYLSLSLSLSLCVSVSLSVSLYFYLSIYLSTHLCLFLVSQVNPHKQLHTSPLRTHEQINLYPPIPHAHKYAHKFPIIYTIPADERTKKLDI